jgi:flagellar P-ring protein precursor FlgI
VAALVAAVAVGPGLASAAEARIKDVARIAGLEQIQLIGYGVVAGLRGSGDKDLALTKQTMANLMENFQITMDPNDVKSKNVAAVMVTAIVPPFHSASDKVDVEVSSLGDATSLEGGMLLMTPMLDPNGEVYALSQGAMILGGYSVGQEGAGGNTVTKNHTTTAIVPGGATLRRGYSGGFHQNGIMRLVLRHADFTTATRMATAINQEFGGLAVAKDAATVAVRIPDHDLDTGQSAVFVARLEALKVVPDQAAKVIVNERTGTIVMGGDVVISPTVVAHGNLTVNVKESLHPSHPANLTLVRSQPGIRSLETPDTQVKVEEDKARVMMLPGTATVRELADTLHLMGATPRDLISILEALHRLGALQMELVAM